MKGCTFRGNRKTWVAVDDINSNTASVIDVMVLVQKIVIEYKKLL